ncbi:MAG TPA: outer membrane beta-barrel protein [Saprospiraceae bacterium]|nr:outer membrane beta-barrel protein [Saprospiraceae bacterium]HPB52763.1 outer membrane beta-barrel protein [Saprospiraceae bacterium]HRN34964.1 outer membrane beta-barrel protein [Saprospiraceae bacterium]
MKSIRTTLCMLLVALFTLQSDAQGGLYLGLNGSGNATIVANQMNYGQKEMDYDAVTFRPAFGLELGYDLNGGSMLSIGANLQQAGQKYKDGYGNGDKLNKEIKMSYFAIPVTYRLVFGGKKDPNHGTKFFVAVGPQISLIQSAEVTHQVNEKEVTLETFANHIAGGGAPYNFNSAEIGKLTTNGEPANDKDLFASMDIEGFVGLGIQSFLSESFFMTLELRGGGSLTDINAKDWRLDGYKDGQRQKYEASRNVFAGLRLGLNYKF